MHNPRNVIKTPPGHHGLHLVAMGLVRFRNASRFGEMNRSSIQKNLLRGAIAGLIVSISGLLALAPAGRQSVELQELIGLCAAVLGWPLSSIFWLTAQKDMDFNRSLYGLHLMVPLDWALVGAVIGLIVGRSGKRNV